MKASRDVILGLIVAWLIFTTIQGRQDANGLRVQDGRIHHVQAHQNDALHRIICFAELRVRQSPVLTRKQKEQAVKFYDEALRKAHLEPCTTTRRG